MLFLIYIYTFLWCNPIERLSLMRYNTTYTMEYAVKFMQTERINFMASITKRGNNFRIKVSLGYDSNYKQIVKSTTYTPPEGTSPKKAEKLAVAYAVEFENHCKGYIVSLTRI